MKKGKHIRTYILPCTLLSAALFLSGCQAAGTAALPDFDEKADEFFTFYQGTSISVQCTAAYESGMLSEYMEKNYNVLTDKGSYSVSLCFTLLENEEKGLDEGRIGLNSILILTSDLADEAQYTQWPPEDGIFILHDIGDCRT